MKKKEEANTPDKLKDPKKWSTWKKELQSCMCVPKNTRDQKRTCTAYKDEWQDAAKEGLPGHGRWGERSGRRRRRRRIVGEQPKRRRRQMYLGIPLPFSCNQRDGKSLQITVIPLPLSLSLSCSHITSAGFHGATATAVLSHPWLSIPPICWALWTIYPLPSPMITIFELEPLYSVLP